MPDRAGASSGAVAATRALIEEHAGATQNEIADQLYFMLAAADSHALESRPLGIRCRCGRGLGYAHYHDGMIVIYKDALPQKVPLAGQAGYSLTYAPARNVSEASSLRPVGFDAFAAEAGEHGYLRRKVICPRPKGCGAQYPWEPVRILVAWLTATSAHETELRVGRRPEFVDE